MKPYRPLSALLTVILFFILCLSVHPAIFAQVNNQSKIVTGKITSSSGEAIAGATVQLKGALSGTSSDDKGEFSISVQSGRSTLIISNVGFKEKEVVVRNQSTLSVIL